MGENMLKKILLSTLCALLVVLFGTWAWAVEVNLAGGANITPATVVFSPEAARGAVEVFQATRKVHEQVIKIMHGEQDEMGKGSGDDNGDDVLSEDADLDGIPDVDDNCMDVANEDQLDEDEDGVGDLCDADFNPSAALPEGFDEGGACSLAPASSLNGGLLAFMLSIAALAIRRRR